MFVDVIMSLETPSFLVCVQTDHERASKKQVCAHKLNGLMRLDVQQKLARRWRLHEFENVSQDQPKKSYFYVTFTRKGRCFASLEVLVHYSKIPMCMTCNCTSQYNLISVTCGLITLSGLCNLYLAMSAILAVSEKSELPTCP